MKATYQKHQRRVEELEMKIVNVLVKEEAI